jgi:hypothetical protein
VPVIYDLRQKIAGFDFFTWLVMQKTDVSFYATSTKTDKFTKAEALRRYESILKPGVALAGLHYDELGEGSSTKGGQQDLVNHCRSGGTFKRLKTVQPKGKERYTITLRTTRRWLHRNSKEAVWRDFAKEIGARVIPDYEIEPIHLHERMSLYAGAEMNFFVTNGPVILCFLSEYPAMSFDVQQSPMIQLGIPMGGQYPFLLPDRHRQIYEPDEPEVIRRHFYHWKQTGQFL